MGKDFTKSYYYGLKGFYFSRILKTIIRLGALDQRDLRILDFGCGVGKLSQMLPGKVIGYDRIQALSDVSDWRDVRFDVVVANEVFYLFDPSELSTFLIELRNINSKAELLVGISRQRMLNNVLKYIGGESDAHSDTKLRPEEELDVLTNYLKISQSISVFQLCDVYHMRFAPS